MSSEFGRLGENESRGKLSYTKQNGGTLRN
jgi:hypothetical protein